MGATCSGTSTLSRPGRSQGEEVAPPEGKKGKSNGKKIKDVEAVKKALEGWKVLIPTKTSEQLVAFTAELENLLEAVEDYLKEEVGTEKQGSTLEQLKQTESNSVQSTKSKIPRRFLIQYADYFGDFFTKVGDGFKRTGDYTRTAFDPQASGLCLQALKLVSTASSLEVSDVKSWQDVEYEEHFLRDTMRGRNFELVKNDIVKTVSKTFGHAGQVHWAGLLLSGFAFVISRWDLLKTNKERLKKIMKYGLQLGRAVLKATKTVEENGDGDFIAFLQAEVVFIFCVIDEFTAEIKKSSPRKFLTGDCTKELLDKYEKEIDRLFNQLTNAVVLKTYGATKEGIEELDKKVTKLDEKFTVWTETTATLVIPEYSMSTSFEEDEFDKIVPAIGIEWPLEAVKEKLKISVVEGQVAKIGAVAILGMGGIGKSTLGKRLCCQLAGKEFDKDMICILDMSPGSSNTVQTLQDELLLTFDHRKYEVASENVVKQRLKNSFQRLQRRVFIFIDNVEDLEKLEKLLPDRIIKYLPDGSRVMVASRSSYIKATLEAIGIDPDQIELFQMELLDQDSSRRLLRYHMRRDAELSDRFIQYEDQVLKGCEGLPLALEVIARSLKDKETEEDQWRYVIQALTESLSPDGSLDDKLSRVLDVSYDQLNNECKDALLDISFCFNQSSWSDLKILYGQRLEILRDRGLVKKEVKLFRDSGLRLECAKVHSCFVALCRKEAHVSGSHIRISGSIESWNLEKVPRVLVVEGGYRGGYQIAQAADLDKQLGSLRILLITDVIFRGQCERLPKQLKCLYCHHSNLPFPLGNLDSLTLVDISSAADTEYRIPRGVRTLRLDAPSLEILEFASESKLEELGLMFCPRLQLHFNQTALSCLRKLVIRHGRYIKTLPTSSRRLLSVSIQSCTSFNLPEDLSGLERLEHLHISGSRILVNLPENLSGLENLNSLVLEDCPLLEKLPENMGSSPKFRILESKGCPRLKPHPASFHSWGQDTEDNRGNTDEHRADKRRDETSRWLKGSENAEELKQKAIAAKYMIPLIHTRGTFDRLSDLVYELYSEHDPDVEIVVLPGFCKTLDNREAHWRTWRRKGTEECWLQTLLPEELKRPKIKARILSVSYERLLNNSLEPEDLLMRDLILHPDSGVGQQRNVPVILVGHGLGGIVIKYFVRSVLEKLEGVEEDKGDKLRNFLTNLKALVFYSTPMLGSPVMEKLAASIEENSPDKMLRFLKVFNKGMAILNQEIASKRKSFNIKSLALCELNVTNEGDFHNDLVVPEASARVDTDSCRCIAEDHYGVAQAEDKFSSSVVFLADIVEEIVDESKRLSTGTHGQWQGERI